MTASTLSGVADESPEVRLARVEERTRTLSTTVEAFGPTARQVIEATAGLEVHARDIRDAREEIAEVEQRVLGALQRSEQRSKDAVARVEASCKAVTEKLDNFQTVRQTSRATIIVGLLGVSGTLVAAILPQVVH